MRRSTGMKNYLEEGIPTLEEAKIILEEGSKLNPGPWIDHSLYVGKAAELITKEDKELDSNIALILGMLHDIGRRYGVTGMRHSIDGYNFSAERGYNLLARICLTNSNPLQDVDAVFGSPSVSPYKENGAARLLKQGQTLTSPEKQMTVEEWIHFNAAEAEKKLKHECEAMVSRFESEGTKAMRVLEGLVVD